MKNRISHILFVKLAVEYGVESDLGHISLLKVLKVQFGFYPI